MKRNTCCNCSTFLEGKSCQYVHESLQLTRMYPFTVDRERRKSHVSEFNYQHKENKLKVKTKKL